MGILSHSWLLPQLTRQSLERVAAGYYEAVLVTFLTQKSHEAGHTLMQPCSATDRILWKGCIHRRIVACQ
jgi:hypothetical protein